MSVVQWVTDVADGAVLLPLAGLVALVLAAQRRWRTALAWTLSVGATLGLMLALKLAVAGCGTALGALGLRSPSGHTAAAAVVYGGLFAMLAGLRGWDAALPGLAVAAAIAGTRIALGVHSLADVMVGATVGVGGSVVLAHAARLAEDGPEASGHAVVIRRPGAGAAWLLGGAAGLALLLHGRHLDVEDRIHAAGVRLGAQVCGPAAGAQAGTRGGGKAVLARAEGTRQERPPGL